MIHFYFFLTCIYIFVNEIFLGLAFDSWDMDFYMDLFVNKLKRDPTSVELFDLAQSNSEHSRHWFFKVGNLFQSPITLPNLFLS